ncbi:MAG: AMP-binding protein, partial [Polyangiaceae bacterium]|nr:AMP-binding protein [Polyangiaceae bacterium]
VYTSGTTGKPKGAVRKFSRNSLIAALQLLSTTPMAHDDIHLVVCPMYHTTAYGFLGLTHLLGGTAVIAEDFRPETFLAQVEEHQVTTVAMVPTMLHRLMRHPDPAMREKLRSLRTIVTTGSPLTAALAKEVSETLGPIVYNIYGSTETGAVTLATPSDLAEAPGTIGRAVPGCEIRLLKEDGSLAKAGEIGELYAKNHLVVTGYHNDSSATNACVREGFFSVGDLATFDREGRYFIAGRKHDMIISGGVNVYPVEIEAVLEQHPSILEAAIVGVDHPEWGESVRAFVVMRSDHVFDQEALRIFAREHLSGPKMPREFIVLETLPRNPTGKILKRELRAHMSGP